MSEEPQAVDASHVDAVTPPGVSADATSDPFTEVEDPAVAAAQAQAGLEARAEADPRTRPELIAALESLESERDTYLDDLRRSHADFENYRKRVARDATVQREQGRADVVTALLEVLDDLDRVIAAAGSLPEADADQAAVVSAVRSLGDKTQRTLQGLGIERIDEGGVLFDPVVHDAVQQHTDETVAAPTVHALLRPGYRLGDRVLRAAMVAVVQP